MLTHLAATAWSGQTSAQVTDAIAAGFRSRPGVQVQCSTLAPTGKEFFAALAQYYQLAAPQSGIGVGRDPDDDHKVAVVDLQQLCPKGDSLAAGTALQALLAQVAVSEVLLVEAEAVSDFGAGLVDVLVAFARAPEHRLSLVAAPAEPYFNQDRSRREQWAQQLIDRLGAAPVNAALGTGEAGCAAGLGLLIKTCGGSVQDPYQVVAVATQLAQRLAEVELLVVAVEVFDYRSLRASAVTAAVACAGSWGIPVVVLAGVVDVGRRELAAVGVSGAYAVTEEILDNAGNLGAELSLAELTECSVGVAKTWCRSTR